MLPCLGGIEFRIWQSAVHPSEDGRHKLSVAVFFILTNLAFAKELFKHAEVHVNELKGNVCIAWLEKYLIECDRRILTGMLVRRVLASGW